MSSEKEELKAVASEDIEDVSLSVQGKSEDESEQAAAEEPSASNVIDNEEELPPLPSRKQSKDENSAAKPGKPVENSLLKQLKDAFPNVEEQYVKAVIIASEGRLDPAFNALLYLSDPESGADIQLPTEPIRELPPRRQKTQLEQDEMLARQLDEEYNRSGAGRKRDRAEQKARQQRLRDRERRRQMPMNSEGQMYGEGSDADSWSQFVEKDLPEIRDRANKSIQETANKLNTWLSGVKKSLVGEEEDGGANSGMAGSYHDIPAGRQPERRRFNSFGASVGNSPTIDTSLATHGISLQNDDDDEDVPPQLPSRTRTRDSSSDKRAENNVVAQTAYIDTPERSAKKAWSHVAPEPMDNTPTKAKTAQDPEEEENFLINSDDEL